MKRTIIAVACCLIMLYTGQAQSLRTPAPSPTQTIKQNFALSSIELSYSRPVKKGRKVMGDLVPYGKVWRTGANQATTLTFGEEVMIGGQTIPAGKYGLLSIPDKTKWTLIITKQTDVTSPADYKPESDVVRVDVKTSALLANVESFTMQFVDVKPSTCRLQLTWEKTSVSLPIAAVNLDGKIMANINQIMRKEPDTGKDNRPYFPAALYYMENGKDKKQALAWFDKAIEQNPNAFWVWHQRANCLAKMGKKTDAVTSANKSIELAKEAKNDDYVALNKKLLATLK
jgi:hypothetical protein